MTDWSSRPRPVGESRWNFPPPGEWPEGDIVAAGGDLAPATLVSAYRHGLFPMVVDGRDHALGWWSPDPRGVLPIEGLAVSRSLARSCRRFEIRLDTAFDDVVAACADPRRPGRWITPRIAEAYRRLHGLGWAHSVECWRDGRLVGGLYGVALGGLFAGESMFHRETDASKVALVALVRLLAEDRDDRRLLDVQWRTEHLASLGVQEINRQEYRRRLARALTAPRPRAFRTP